MPHGKSKVGQGGNKSWNHAVNTFSCRCGWSATGNTTASDRDVNSRERRLIKRKVELHRKYCDQCAPDDRNVVNTTTAINWSVGSAGRVRTDIEVPDHLVGLDRARAYINALHHLQHARADLQ